MPSPAFVKHMVTFDASASYDPDGTIELYEWDLGDGSVGEGQIITHAFSASGTYLVRLTVIDEFGFKSEITKEVLVRNIAHRPIFRRSSHRKRLINLLFYINSSSVDQPDS